MVVVSITNNGYLALTTGFDGSFAFRGRPHQPGHRIVVTGLGYRELVYRLRPGDSTLGLRVDADPGGPPRGWSVGLPEVVGAQVLTGDGRELRVDVDRLQSGAPYRVRLRLTETSGCREVGAGTTGISGGIAVVAVAVFERAGGPCPESRVVELPFRAGDRPEVRVVGRRRDVILTFRPAG